MVIDWQENHVPVLTVEAPRRFRRLVAELQNQWEGGDGGFVLSRNWEPIPLSKNCDLICEPLFAQVNNRLSTSALARWLRAQAMGEAMYLDTLRMNQELSQWLGHLMDCSQAPLCWSGEVDLGQLIKACGVEFEGDDADLPERLYRRVRVAQSFLHVNAFIFINLKRCLEQEELNELYRALFYQNARVMLVENTCAHYDLRYETPWILDRDDCEIYPDEI